MLKKRILILIGIIFLVTMVIKLSTGKNYANGEPLKKSGETSRVITVNAEEVSYKDFRKTPVFTGNIKPLYDISIVARTTAQIEKIAKTPGEFVKANEVFAYLESSEQTSAVAEAEASLALAQAQLLEAENNYEIAQKAVEQARLLFDRQFISETQFDVEQAKFLSASSALELARAQLVQKRANLNTARLRKSYTTLSSPRSGLIGDMHFDEGSIINQNAVFTNVVVIDSVLCEIRVPEVVHTRIKKGMPAILERTIETGKNASIFAGHIYSISPIIDTQTRTAAVQIIFPNPKHTLKPGMFARISLVLVERDSVLAVPQKAIVEYKNRKGIFSVIGDSTVTFIPVETGLSAQGFVEIFTEQKPEKVVTEGQFMLFEGARILIPSQE
ncbi:MAG: hypothetical protein APR54_03120 [Candidatus Cloacimonas sp. SDB]|nr:MAG: hypothetical protein APR54_03120 [Candidatus Cloacimonas sp. SDB]